MLATVLQSFFKGSAQPVWSLTVLRWGMEAVMPQSTMFLAKMVVYSLASFLGIFLLTLFSWQHNLAKLLRFVCFWLFVCFVLWSGSCLLILLVRLLPCQQASVNQMCCAGTLECFCHLLSLFCKVCLQFLCAGISSHSRKCGTFQSKLTNRPNLRVFSFFPDVL